MRKLSRRDLLVGTASVVLIPACRGGIRIGDPDDTDRLDTDIVDTDTGTDTGWTYEPGPEPEIAWDPGTAVDAATFAWGVQVGDAAETGAIVGVQVLADAVTMRVARATDAGWEETSVTADLTPVDEVVRVELTGLIPDTTYAVCFEAASGRSPVTRFRTALYPGTSRVVRFGATSCLHANHAPWPCLPHAAAEKLDFFVLLGDTIYGDGGDGDIPWFKAIWREALGTDGLKVLSGSTSLVATWDDHEIDNDWQGLDDDAARQEAARASFRAAIPQREGSEGVLWRKLSWGDTLDLFVLDCRGERSGSTYVGLLQMAWLKQSLSESTARFKIIVNSVPITDWSDTVLWNFVQDDRWQGYPVDREEILAHIRDQGVGGVLWIAGDHHFGGITHVDPSGGIAEDQIEVLCGPGGSSINSASYLIPINARYPAIVKTWNWTRFVADPDAGTVAITFVDDDGDEVATETFSL